MGIGGPGRPAGRSITALRTQRRPSLSRRCASLLRRRLSCVLLAAAGLSLLLGVCQLYLLESAASQPFFAATEGARAVTLLIWTHPFGRYHELPDCFARYQISGCTLTDDEDEYPRADAVLIHHREVALGTAQLPPEPRPRAQKWIWMNYESPTHTRGLGRLEGAFNLTMSYRADSDIFLPYGFLIPRAANGSGRRRRRRAHRLQSPSRARLLRPRLVAWVISHWAESQERVQFYYQLRRHIRVDVFGRAGRKLPGDVGGSGSVVRLLERYQFYLALENSQHTDYITEKLWNAVEAGAVPVVLGPPRHNYERFLPPEAFIHVDDFPTVQELARYLSTLRRNPELLMRHLDWRGGGYSVHQPAFWGEHFCTACRAVRRTRGRTDAVQHLTRWFQS